MNLSEKRLLLTSMGMKKTAIDYYMNLEEKDLHIAYVTSAKFAYSLSNNVKYFKNEYINKLNSGIYEDEMIQKIKNYNVPNEVIAEIYYDIYKEAFYQVLYNILEYDGVDTDPNLPEDYKKICEKAFEWRLVEVDKNGKFTGKFMNAIIGIYDEFLEQN